MTNNHKDHEYPVSLDEKLVAYLLGEADAEVAAEVEAALEADPALQLRREQLQATLGLIRTPEFAPALDTARRDELRAAAGGATPESTQAATGGGTLHRFPMMRAAAALVIFGGLVTIWQKPWESEMAPGEAASLDAASSSEFGYVGPGADASDLDDRYKKSSSGEPETSTSGRPEAERSRGVDRDLVDAEEPALDSLNFGLATQPNGGVGAGGGVGGSIPVNPKLGLADITPPLSQDSRGLTAPASPRIGLITATPNTPAPSAGLSVLGYTGLSSGAPDPVRAARPDHYWEVEKSSEELGSSSEYFDRSVSGDFRARRELSEDSLGLSFDQGGEELEIAPRFGLVDGFGRSYYEESLIEHLRPHCRQCREVENHHGRCEHHESPQAMFFRFYGDNPVTLSANDNFSTFAADVDTASYPLTRNYLVNGSLPPKTAIRTEEFVNYFKLGLAPPTEGDFAVHLDAMPSLFSDGSPRLLLRAGVQARVVSREDRKPLNLVFVIDKSGSMASENRLELVKRSLELLVDQLRDDDTVGIVTFDSNGHSVLAPTPGHLRWEIREAIRGLTTGGSTNAGAGLEIGFAMAEQAFRADAVNRVILASDGVANTGETDQQVILDKVRAHAEAHIDLTTIGVGMGNHNDVFLEQLADKGDGSCHYVDDFSEAKRVLVDGFTGVMQVVARDVKIQLEFDGEVVEGWRQLGYENRSLTQQQFRDDSVDAGEVGAGHSVAALYELDLASGAGGDAQLVTLRLRWFPDGSDEAVEKEYTLKLGAARTKWSLSEPRLRLSAVAAQYAEVLRRSYHARSDSYDVLKSESEALARELSDDASVVELRDMIARTESLARLQPLTDPLAMLVEEARITRLQEAELARMEQDAQTGQLLDEIRAQNDRIEAQIRELTKPR